MAWAMVFLKVVGCAVGLVVASFALLVALPVRISVWGKAGLLGALEEALDDMSQVEVQGRFELAILGGIFKFSPGKRKPEPVQSSDQPLAKAKGSKGSKGFVGSIQPYLTRDVRRAFFEFGKRVLGATRVKADLHITYGLEDPAATGLIYGAYEAVSGCAGVSFLRLTPVFTEEILDFEGFLELRAIPAVFFWHSVVFAMSSKIRPLWWGKSVNLRKVSS